MNHKLRSYFDQSYHSKSHMIKLPLLQASFVLSTDLQENSIGVTMYLTVGEYFNEFRTKCLSNRMIKAMATKKKLTTDCHLLEADYLFVVNQYTQSIMRSLVLLGRVYYYLSNDDINKSNNCHLLEGVCSVCRYSIKEN